MKLVRDLDTPSVTVDLPIMEANLKRVQTHLSKHGIGNRPHIKSHKIPALGKMQMQAGAMGITCQKLGEVEVFADAGVADDVLLTYNIVGWLKTERLIQLNKRIKKLTVVFDNEVVARGISETAKRHGATVRFLVECDTGFGRNGVQSPKEAFDLARTAMKLPGLQFEGLMISRTASRPERSSPRRWRCSRTRASRSRSCRAAARRHCSPHRTCRC